MSLPNIASHLDEVWFNIAESCLLWVQIRLYMYFKGENMKKSITMGIKLSTEKVSCRFYGSILGFMAPMTRSRNTKFPTVKIGS